MTNELIKEKEKKEEGYAFLYAPKSVRSSGNAWGNCSNNQ
jgi:hypothetical protein